MPSTRNQCVLVYDVGGSHISAALCSAGDYRLGPVAHTPHEDRQSIAAFVDALESLAAQATTDACEVAGASLAMPGPFDYREGVSWMRHKLPYLYGLNLRREFAERMGWESEQVRFLNDAAAFLLGEVGTGEARGFSRVVGITIGTGIGSAFAIDGKIQTSGAGVPPGGEIWNVPFEGGIVEDLISTRSIKKRYREGVGVDREVADIAAGATNDPAAVKVFAEFGTDLGRVLKSLLSEFAPDAVVLGGGISHGADLFLPATRGELQGLAMQVRVSSLGDRAPLVGAGVAWFAGSATPESSLANKGAQAEAQ
jgi:glucokinase